ncbi:MAG: O-antigen ligase family protein [Patescibacteria group bacterium]|nr:O-antigen ligase family protein [Patescibacteria group bacterium]
MRNSLYDSYFYKVWRFLFLNRQKWEISKTSIGRIFQRFYIPYATEVLIFVSIIIFWYEGLITRYWASFPSDWLGITCLILALLFADKKKMFFGKPQLYLLIFYLFIGISGIFALIRGLDPTMVFKGFLLFLQFGLVLFAAQSLESKKKVIDGILVLSLPISVISIYQFLSNTQTSHLWLSPGELQLTRVFAFFGSPNVLGILMAMISILSFGSFLKSKKYYYLIPSGLSVLATGFTFSRSAWLGLVMALAIGIVIYNYKYLIFSPLILLGLIIPQVRNRIEISLSGNYLMDSSLDGRIWALINGLYIFKRYPFIGAGPGSYGGKLAANYASPIYLQGIQNGYTALYFTDNQYLEILVQGGIIGFLSFCGFIISVITSLIQTYRRNKDILVLTGLAVFVCFLTGGLFANVLEFGAIAVPMAIILGMSLSEND